MRLRVSDIVRVQKNIIRSHFIVLFPVMFGSCLDPWLSESVPSHAGSLSYCVPHAKQNISWPPLPKHNLKTGQSVGRQFYGWVDGQVSLSEACRVTSHTTAMSRIIREDSLWQQVAVGSETHSQILCREILIWKFSSGPTPKIGEPRGLEGKLQHSQRMEDNRRT